MGCSCEPFKQDLACSTHPSALLRVNFPVAAFEPVLSMPRAEFDAAFGAGGLVAAGPALFVAPLPPIVDRDPGDETDHVDEVAA